jgi:hypothetical protein
MRDQTRRVRHELEEQVREETRRTRRGDRVSLEDRVSRWHEHRRGPGAPINSMVLMVVMLALTAARLGIWSLFRVFLPTLLFALSIFFGRPLRRAAWRCREVGARAERGLRHGFDAVRGRLLGLETAAPAPETELTDREPAPRTRVSTRPRRVEVEPESDLDDYSERIAERERREPR